MEICKDKLKSETKYYEYLPIPNSKEKSQDRNCESEFRLINNTASKS